MEYVGIVFGVFGLFAYVELFSLKKRVVALEEELAGIAGTASYEERRSLLDAVSGYIGKQVKLELKEDCEDVDADGEWILVRVDSAKGSKEKLIRAGSVQRISLVNEK